MSLVLSKNSVWLMLPCLIWNCSGEYPAECRTLHFILLLTNSQHFRENGEVKMMICVLNWSLEDLLSGDLPPVCPGGGVCYFTLQLFSQKDGGNSWMGRWVLIVRGEGIALAFSTPLKQVKRKCLCSTSISCRTYISGSVQRSLPIFLLVSWLSFGIS